MSHGPGPSVGPDDGTDATERFRVESELRRLTRELDLERESAVRLHERLRQAEREAATSTGAVVDAMAAELARWQDRALVAESDLAELTATKLFRARRVALALSRAGGKAPALGRKLVQRFG